MMFNPHKLGVHKVLKHIPLNALFDIPYKRALKKAVNIADLRVIAKSRAHKVSVISGFYALQYVVLFRSFLLSLNPFFCCICIDGF
jgi:hypothetical protein